MLGWNKGKSAVVSSTPYGRESMEKSPRLSTSDSYVSKLSEGSYEDEDDDYVPEPVPRLRKKWRSSLLDHNEPYEKPWLEIKEPKKIWERVIFFFGCACGAGLGIWLCVSSYTKNANHAYCLVMEDDFKTLDTSTWNFEIQRGGFNEGSFEWTTNDRSNVFVDKHGLHIVPTLTTETTSITERQLNDGYTLNLTATGECTSRKAEDCAVVSNSSAGYLINPVRSGRINTKGHKAIKYGRVEVVAKMPKGDWIWPSIRMMPVDEAYGAWPASGEIDIAMLRGNALDAVKDGRDTMTSTLHWGPEEGMDASFRTIGGHFLKRRDYSDGFHTFGLEWGPSHIYTYLDGRPLQVFFVSFPEGSSMWDQGKFSSQARLYNDPWSWTGNPNTPFDKPFYLILDVAVGGTNGWWVQGQGEKPWDNSDPTAAHAFYEAKDVWYPTWGKGSSKGMTVKSVKMWELGKCGSASN
ncbi:hypothetical protein AAFC00_004445 [Neodothiora populina]|uniref:GH16 domain-containing protein n=1 Tax=Neodothiora populina TaxID=2781224 RepID=A0ABR3P201_9PEZI